HRADPDAPEPLRPRRHRPGDGGGDDHDVLRGGAGQPRLPPAGRQAEGAAGGAREGAGGRPRRRPGHPPRREPDDAGEAARRVPRRPDGLTRRPGQRHPHEPRRLSGAAPPPRTMARRRAAPVEDDMPTAPFCMATFSDMVTLLMTFFIMIVAMSEVQIEKFREALSYFQGGTGLMEAGPAPVVGFPTPSAAQLAVEHAQRQEALTRQLREAG